MGGNEEAFEISNAWFLPIVSAYAARIGLVEQIDRLLHCQMEVSPGRVVLALMLDALTGRSPLFRLEQFFVDKDVEHLLGEAIPLSRLNDDTLGRVLDRLADVGTNTVLGAVMIGVMKSFELDMSHVHHDVTSHSVYGDYLLYEWEGHAQPFVITEGFKPGPPTRSQATDAQPLVRGSRDPHRLQAPGRQSVRQDHQQEPHPGDGGADALPGPRGFHLCDRFRAHHPR